MSFIWPVMLFLLFLLPLPALLYLRIQKRRQRLYASYGGLGLWNAAMGKQPGSRRHLPPALFLAGLAIMSIALARPQMVVSVPKVEGTVILAFDVSGSMGADDLKPTRLDAAKAAARDFIQRQPSSVQVGVVAFSDNGFAVQAPTGNQDEILAAINRLTPQRGTSLANGILASLNSIASSTGKGAQSQGPLQYSNLTPAPTPSPTPVPKGTYTPAVIILLTDGENNENPNPFTTAQSAADRGVRIYTIGIGSAAGADVHINGFSIHTQLDDATLKQISQITGGAYYNAESAQDLIKIYDTIDPQLVIKPEKTEVTSLFAGASLLVLLVGAVISMLWFGHMP
ncbi:MAG: VWA domain-containing protein [Omnitrophica WOR_2 bacterium]